MALNAKLPAAPGSLGAAASGEHPAVDPRPAASTAGLASSDEESRWHDAMQRALMNSLQPHRADHPTWWGKRFHGLQASCRGGLGLGAGPHCSLATRASRICLVPLWSAVMEQTCRDLLGPAAAGQRTQECPAGVPGQSHSPGTC